MLDTVDGLVVDSESGVFYWTDSGTKLISVSTLDGKYTRILIWKDLLSPRSIALNKKTSEIFWTDWGVRAAIEKSGKDGTGRKSIINTGLIWPNAITIDFERNKVVWADAYTKKLEISNFDGSGRKTLNQLLKHPFAITAFHGLIFLTDWELSTILKGSV